jgi:hypothetical protein
MSAHWVVGSCHEFWHGAPAQPPTGRGVGGMRTAATAARRGGTAAAATEARASPRTPDVSRPEIDNHTIDYRTIEYRTGTTTAGLRRLVVESPWSQLTRACQRC